MYQTVFLITTNKVTERETYTRNQTCQPKGKERKGKERKGKERKGKERKGKERGLKESHNTTNSLEDKF